MEAAHADRLGAGDEKWRRDREAIVHLQLLGRRQRASSWLGNAVMQPLWGRRDREPLHTGSACSGRSHLQLKVSWTGSNHTGAFWTGLLLNKHTGQQHTVGTLFYPHLPGMQGFGNLQAHSDDFLEYFAGGSCEGAVMAQVGISGPYSLL